MTFGELFDLYMSVYAKQHCKSWRNMERMYQCYLAHWADRQITEITRLDVIRLQSELAERISPTTSNRVIELISMTYRKAAEFGIACVNPASGIRKFRLKPRDRFFEQNELQRLFAAIEKLRYPVTRDFLYMCLYTGARRSNVAAMRWDQINFEQAIWFVPDTKNGTSQYIPLVDAALTVLSKRERKSVWVFPSTRSNSGHLTKPELAWSEVCKKAKLDNARIHDLRRTLASWQALTGANLSVIAATLNHKDIKSTQIYAKLNTAAVKSAMDTAFDAMISDKM